MKNIVGLKKTAEFKRVYEKRKTYADKYLIIYAAKNNENVLKLGISVSKKIGNSVVRHRVSRLIREAYRLNNYLNDGGIDIVVVAREAAAGAGFREIEQSYLKLVKRHLSYYEK